jgi:hypothetical protein
MLQLVRRCAQSASVLTAAVSSTSTAVGAGPFRFLVCSAAIMGTDCCGAEEGVQALTVEDVHGTSEGTTAKLHADFLAERQPFYAKRIEMFEKYLEREHAKVEAAKEAREAIKVVLPDGNTKEAVKGVTTPMDIARGISAGLAKKVVVAKVETKEWDLNRPLIADCALQLFGPDSKEGLDVRCCRPCGTVSVLATA